LDLFHFPFLTAYETNPQTKALLDLIDVPDRFEASFGKHLPTTASPAAAAPAAPQSFSAAGAATAAGTTTSMYQAFAEFASVPAAVVANPEEIDLD
jgi:hypothetical protein